MLIRNIKNAHDLEMKRKLQAEILQIQIDNEKILDKRVSDFKNPNKPPPVPPQYKTVSEIQKDIMEQQKQVIQNLRDYGIDFNEAVKIINILPELLGGTQNLYKFNQFFPAIKEKILKNLNPKDLDSQTLKERLRKFFDDIDSSIGLNFEGIKSTNIFNGEYNESQLILGSKEQYEGLFKTLRKIIQYFLPIDKTPPELLKVMQDLEPQVQIMCGERERKEEEEGPIVGIAPTYEQLSGINGLSYVERRAYLQALNNFVSSDGFPSYKYLNSLNDKIDESGIFRLDLIRKASDEAVEGFQDTEKEYSQKLSYTNTQLIAELNDLSQKLGYALTPPKIERLRNFKMKLKTIKRGMDDGGGSSQNPPNYSGNQSRNIVLNKREVIPERSERTQGMLDRADEIVISRDPNNYNDLLYADENQLTRSLLPTKTRIRARSVGTNNGDIPTAIPSNPSGLTRSQDYEAKIIRAKEQASKVSSIKKRNDIGLEGNYSSGEEEELPLYTLYPAEEKVKSSAINEYLKEFFKPKSNIGVENNLRRLEEVFDIPQNNFSSKDSFLNEISKIAEKAGMNVRQLETIVKGYDLTVGQLNRIRDDIKRQLQPSESSSIISFEKNPILGKKGQKTNKEDIYDKRKGSLSALSESEYGGSHREYKSPKADASRPIEELRVHRPSYEERKKEIILLYNKNNKDNLVKIYAGANRSEAEYNKIKRDNNKDELLDKIADRVLKEEGYHGGGGGGKKTTKVIKKKRSPSAESEEEPDLVHYYENQAILEEYEERENNGEKLSRKEKEDMIDRGNRYRNAKESYYAELNDYDIGTKKYEEEQEKLEKLSLQQLKNEYKRKILEEEGYIAGGGKSGKGVRRRILDSESKKQSFIKSRIKIGKGIEKHIDEPKFRAFGKFMILMPQLRKENILNLKYQSNGPIPSIKPVKIDDNYKEFVIDVLDSGRVNDRHYKSLTEPEQMHFIKITRGAGIFDHLKLKNENHNKETEELKRLELLLGECEAGNDNEKMIKEAKTLIKKYVSNGRINKNKGMDMLMTLEK